MYRRDEGAGRILASIDTSGGVERLPMKPASYLWPRLSPSGDLVAMTAIESGRSTVWIYDRKLNRATRVAPNGESDGYPLWTPDGRFLLLGGPTGLTWTRPRSDDTVHTLLTGKVSQVPWSLTANGDRLAYHAMGASTGFDLWTVPISISTSGVVAGKPELFLQTRTFEVYPCVLTRRAMAGLRVE